MGTGIIHATGVPVLAVYEQRISSLVSNDLRQLASDVLGGTPTRSRDGVAEIAVVPTPMTPTYGTWSCATRARSTGWYLRFAPSARVSGSRGTGCTDVAASSFWAVGGTWDEPALAVDGPGCTFDVTWLPEPGQVEVRPVSSG